MQQLNGNKTIKTGNLALGEGLQGRENVGIALCNSMLFERWDRHSVKIEQV